MNTFDLADILRMKLSTTEESKRLLVLHFEGEQGEPYVGDAKNIWDRIMDAIELDNEMTFKILEDITYICALEDYQAEQSQ